MTLQNVLKFVFKYFCRLDVMNLHDKTIRMLVMLPKGALLVCKSYSKFKKFVDVSYGLAIIKKVQMFSLFFTSGVVR